VVLLWFLRRDVLELSGERYVNMTKLKPTGSFMLLVMSCLFDNGNYTSYSGLGVSGNSYVGHIKYKNKHFCMCDLGFSR
jgi:hypothetical protein